MSENQNSNIYTQIDILDKGFIRLVEHMGNDTSIVRAARVSYGDGTKKNSEDADLIRYLLRNTHTSPFEQVVFTFHIKLPIFVARQWIRHRTARLNEISARYSIMPDEFYIPEGHTIAKQSNKNKQGRETTPVPIEEQEKIQNMLKAHYHETYTLYQKLIKDGIARELARVCLPVSLYTQLYWQIDLHNLFHFLKLRLHKNAQYEIRVYAEAILTIIHQICPIACTAFYDYILHKTEFYSHEYPILSTLLTTTDDTELAQTIDTIAKTMQTLSKREQKLLLEKLTAIKNSS